MAFIGHTWAHLEQPIHASLTRRPRMENRERRESNAPKGHRLRHQKRRSTYTNPNVAIKSRRLKSAYSNVGWGQESTERRVNPRVEANGRINSIPQFATSMSGGNTLIVIDRKRNTSGSRNSTNVNPRRDPVIKKASV